MNKNITSKIHFKVLAVFLAFAILNQVIFPTVAFANTNGPGSADNKSFTPAGNNENVNLFTGDFSYDIPLMDIEGYPITLSYNGDVEMHSEASWVGLGWSCTPGFVGRQMRGLPDDMKGDKMIQYTKLKKDQTNNVVGEYGSGSPIGIGFIGVSYGVNSEKGFSIFNNSYKLLGTEESKTFGSSLNTPEFSDGNSKTTIYNSQRGFSRYNSSFTKQLDRIPIFYDYVGSSNYSSTNVYNSRLGFTSKLLSGGEGKEANSGLVGLIIEFVALVVGITTGGKSFSSLSTFEKIASTSALPEFQTSTSSNGGTMISFGSTSYVPRYGVGFLSFATSNKKSFGINRSLLIFSQGNYTYRKDYNSETYFLDYKVTPGFGLMNSTHWLLQGDRSNLYDVNNERETMILKSSPNLSATNATHDIFHVRSEGNIEDFKIFRNDVGAYHSPFNYGYGIQTDEASSRMIGVPVVTYTKSKSKSSSIFMQGNSLWAGNNNAASNMVFTENLIEPHHEKYFFKSAGEKTIYNADYYEDYGGDQPIHVQLAQTSSPSPSSSVFANYITAKANFRKKDVSGTYSTIPIPNNINTAKDGREPRNTMFVERKAGEPEQVFSQPEIQLYEPYTGGFLTSSGTIVPDSPFERDTKPAHHISEISVTRDNGSKYIYGLPVYNNKFIEHSSNSGSNPQNADGLVNMNFAGAGYDEYLSRVELPANATGYQLTAIVSADYSDRTGNGPSPDDYGHYTKFNYSKGLDVEGDFKWRTPYQSDKGVYSESRKAYNDDNVGSYSYGEKEVYYLHSIETKNYIAEFYLSNREDAYEVAGETTVGHGTKQLKKLDRIELYASQDRIENGSAATPIKAVHFEYDYSLCPNFPANKGIPLPNDINENVGKLTLRKVMFTYGRSVKGAESAYKFEYSDYDHDGDETGVDDVNFPYNFGKVDRWGNYKALSGNPDSENMYTNQEDREAVDRYSAAWKLSKIISPEGSEMEITYEADDYAYVQNKRAMQMFQVVGSSLELNSSNPVPTTSTLYSFISGIIFPHNYIYIKLQEPYTTPIVAGDKDRFKDEYLQGVDYLFFKSLVNLAPSSGPEQDYVKGYAKIKDFGLMNDGEYAWLLLDYYNFNGYGVYPPCNPISKAAWQDLRNDLNRVYQKYTDYTTDKNNLDLIVNGTINSVDLYAKKGYATSFNTGKTWVKLNNPIKKKVGGGSRVKKLLIKDAWEEMTNGFTQVYGIEYFYTKTENDITISSGVASYEPIQGGDENPWKTPIFYNKQNQNFVDDYYYQETPFGESHFPAAVVGYSEVKVRNIPRENVTTNATGYRIHKFYTYKDFPIILDRTQKQMLLVESRPTSSMQFKLNVPTINHLALSQGFVINKNDMHGKPKGNESYSENGSLINKYNIFYKSIPIDATSFKLNNSATVVNEDGSITEEIIGKDMDVFNTYRETFDESSSYGTSTTKKYGLFSWGSGSTTVSKSQSQKKLYTSVTTKVINQYGLVDSIVTEESGSKQVLRNLAYDGKTGVLLLNSTKNEFKDEVYNFHYPAHWYYNNLGQSYINNGIKLTNLFSPVSPAHDGIVSLSSSEVEYFVVGDKILINYNNNTQDEVAWVYKVNSSTDEIVCIDEEGTLLPFNTTDPISIYILESGRKNLQNLPIGTVKTLSSPISGSNLEFADVIESSALEFNENWSTACMPPLCEGDGVDYELEARAEKVNPFFKGVKGKWRVNKAYSYNQKRLPNAVSTANHIRTDGTYASFLPFWDFNTSGKLVPIYDPSYPGNPGNLEKWKLNTEITSYGKDGNLQETKDILDRYSATLNSYNPIFKNIPVAIASNAKQKQIGFDGFEDYHYLDGFILQETPTHFSFFDLTASSTARARDLIDESDAHTGLRSLILYGETEIELNKVVRDDQGHIVASPYYKLNDGDCEFQFSPDPGKYVVSAWVKQRNTVPGTTIEDARITVKQRDDVGANVVTDISFYPTGKVIEGWQRIEGVFDIDEDTYCISVVLENIGEEGRPLINFDDVRIHPFNSGMKSMVYHPYTLRLMAELDDRNYATFFEYDVEGTLVRIKKETENGIVTIKETRSAIQKNNDIGTYGE